MGPFSVRAGVRGRQRCNVEATLAEEGSQRSGLHHSNAVLTGPKQKVAVTVAP